MYNEKLTLSMKSVIMYEAFTGKKFTEIQDTDAFMFMYCVFVCSTGIKVTFPVFQSMYEGKKFRNWIDKEFEDIWKFYLQYPELKRSRQADDDQGEEKTEGNSMSDYANTLIFDYGLDINYVMEKMDMWELEYLFEGASNHMHNEMEDKRLWAYIQMLPNLDKKKCKSVEDFLPFPWSKEEKERLTKQELERETKRANKIIGMDLSELLKK